MMISTFRRSFNAVNLQLLSSLSFSFHAAVSRTPSSLPSPPHYLQARLQVYFIQVNTQTVVHCIAKARSCDGGRGVVGQYELVEARVRGGEEVIARRCYRR
mmetsp:Transcript_13424/g.35210  ORF Transcript_13424/g.35210 Transcript_13424/m.35210 type:complete len:101 (-) Transcript_13424:25-327(-)